MMQAVFHLTKLRLLAVRASGLRKLTPEIAAFTALRRLDVSRSRDLEVQEDIPWSSMTSLKSLDLSECRHLRVCAASQQHPRLQGIACKEQAGDTTHITIFLGSVGVVDRRHLQGVHHLNSGSSPSKIWMPTQCFCVQQFPQLTKHRHMASTPL